MVMKLIPPGSRVLEIGAGAGWQAKALAERGFEVTAIDIPQSNYSALRVWPVIDYDGCTIPAADGQFDVIFTSNVLEHIPHIEEFQREMRRVLKPGGMALHLMPSATWRFWTILTFYLDRLKKVFLRLMPPRPDSANSAKIIARVDSSPRRRSFSSRLLTLMFPRRHGERGTTLSEIYLFSRHRWNGLFRKAGWEVIAVRPNRLFYSGQRVCGHLLSITRRETLSRVLGSSCILYTLKNPDTAQ